MSVRSRDGVTGLRLVHSGTPIPTLAEVHLWVGKLGDFACRTGDLASMLSEAERARAAGYRFEEPRQRFIVGRSLLRVLLGRYVGEPAAELEIEVGPYGKPYLAGSRHSDFRFNVAHAGDLVAIAVTHGRDVGVDVEAIGRGVEMNALMRRLYSKAELAWLDRHLPSTISAAILWLWTCKEAFGKALGTGLIPPTFSLDAALSTCEAVSDLPQAWVHHAGERAWAAHTLPGLDGYVGALVAEVPAGATLPVDLRQFALCAL